MTTEFASNTLEFIETKKFILIDSYVVAKSDIYEIVKWANVHKQQMDLSKKNYDEACAIIKDFMNSSELLVSEDGRQLATYKQQNTRFELDKDTLKVNFPMEYELCLIEKTGNRPFCLK